MLEFGFDAPHGRGDAAFTVTACLVAAFCRTAESELFVGDEVGGPAKFQSFPGPSAIVAELSMPGTRDAWRAFRSPVIGMQIVVALLAVASLGGRFRRRIRTFARPRFMVGKEVPLG